MNRRSSDNTDPRLEQAALYYAGALTTDEAAQFEIQLRQADDDFLADCLELESVAVEFAGSIAAVPPPPGTRDKLLQRAGDPRLRSDSPELERAGIFVRLHNEQDWQDHRVPGIRVRQLYVDRERNTQTVLMRCAPGAKFPHHVHRGAEESLVLEGDLRIGDLVLHPGDYQRCEPGSHHLEQTTETGCLLLIITSLN